MLTLRLGGLEPNLEPSHVGIQMLLSRAIVTGSLASLDIFGDFGVYFSSVIGIIQGSPPPRKSKPERLHGPDSNQNYGRIQS
eukprot:6403856-Amphidinium_carterae.1